MASEVDGYLDHFDAVQRLAERIFDVAAHLQDVSQLLLNDPDEALAEISSNWPTAEQLRTLITEMANAEDQLTQYWAKLPERIRDAMPDKHPDNASGVADDNED